MDELVADGLEDEANVSPNPGHSAKAAAMRLVNDLDSASEKDTLANETPS